MTDDMSPFKLLVLNFKVFGRKWESEGNWGSWQADRVTNAPQELKTERFWLRCLVSVEISVYLTFDLLKGKTERCLSLC